MQGEKNMAKKMLLLIAVTMFPLLLLAQDSSSMGEKKSDHMSGAKATATGCLQKGDEPNGYTLTADDGKVWELQSTKVKLADHVGHKVTVMGTSTKGSDAMEKKKESSETKEAEGKEYGDLKVSSMKMVSESCK